MLGSLLGGATVREGAQTLLNATHLQQQNPTTVVAFVGSHIPKSGDVTALQGLQGLLDAAGSSLSLPECHAQGKPMLCLSLLKGAVNCHCDM